MTNLNSFKFDPRQCFIQAGYRTVRDWFVTKLWLKWLITEGEQQTRLYVYTYNFSCKEMHNFQYKHGPVWSKLSTKLGSDQRDRSHISASGRLIGRTEKSSQMIFVQDLFAFSLSGGSLKYEKKTILFYITIIIDYTYLPKIKRVIKSKKFKNEREREKAFWRELFYYVTNMNNAKALPLISKKYHFCTNKTKSTISYGCL